MVSGGCKPGQRVDTLVCLLLLCLCARAPALGGQPVLAAGPGVLSAAVRRRFGGGNRHLFDNGGKVRYVAGVERRQGGWERMKVIRYSTGSDQTDDGTVQYGLQLVVSRGE